jgi:2-oxoglutarate ferredoxin oxidoreductase subunit alpha
VRERREPDPGPWRGEGARAGGACGATLARPWAVPGTAGLEHRIGGLEKQNVTGNVNYDGANHELMVRIRDQRVRNIENVIPDAVIDGPDSGRVLVLGWGSTYGAIQSALGRLREDRGEASHVHLRHLNPLPANLGAILPRFDHVLIPELNLGQLAMVIRAKYLVKTKSLMKVQGKPFTAVEILDAVRSLLVE